MMTVILLGSETTSEMKTVSEKGTDSGTEMIKRVTVDTRVGINLSLARVVMVIEP